MNNTDTQLKQALAKMLPKKIEINLFPCVINWLQAAWGGKEVLDTELLHLCWLVEDKLIPNQYKEYEKHLYDYEDGNKTGYRWHATWQQRVVALAKVKGIKI